MKIEDVKEFEIANHCYSDTLKINGIDYDKYHKKDIIEFVLEILQKDDDGDFIKETFKACLDYLNVECVESTDDRCEQCGDYNSYSKWIVK